MIVIKIVPSTLNSSRFASTPQKTYHIDKLLRTSQKTADTLKNWHDSHVQNVHSLSPTKKPRTNKRAGKQNEQNRLKNSSKLQIRFTYSSDIELVLQVQELKRRQGQLELEYRMLISEHQQNKQLYGSQLFKLNKDKADLIKKAKQREQELLQLKNLLEEVLMCQGEEM